MFVEINKEIFDALPFAIATVGDTPQQKLIVRAHGLHEHQLIWVKSGEGSFSIGGESFVLSAGEGIFMRCDVPHSYDGKNFHSAWITFSMPSQTLDYLGAGDWFRFSVPDYLRRFANLQTATAATCNDRWWDMSL